MQNMLVLHKCQLRGKAGCISFTWGVFEKGSETHCMEFLLKSLRLDSRGSHVKVPQEFNSGSKAMLGTHCVRAWTSHRRLELEPNNSRCGLWLRVMRITWKLSRTKILKNEAVLLGRWIRNSRSAWAWWNSILKTREPRQKWTQS